MSKQFLFCENLEGGMGRGIYTEDEAVQYSTRASKTMTRMFGEAPDEVELGLWLLVAEVGDMFEYRIGVWVRLKDD